MPGASPKEPHPDRAASAGGSAKVACLASSPRPQIAQTPATKDGAEASTGAHVRARVLCSHKCSVGFASENTLARQAAGPCSSLPWVVTRVSPHQPFWRSTALLPGWPPWFRNTRPGQRSRHARQRLDAGRALAESDISCSQNRGQQQHPMSSNGGGALHRLVL